MRAGEDLHQRRLARRGVADKAEEIAPLVVKRHLVEGGEAAANLATMTEAEQGHERLVLRSAAGVAPADAAERDGDDEERAGEEVLGEDRRPDHGEAVIADRDSEHADQCADDVELALAQDGRAEEGGGE